MSRPASRTGVGASSILLIIVVMCLTLFGVLAFVAARNDASLMQRTGDAAAVYYAADADAQRALAEVDAWIAAGMQGEPDGVTLTRDGDTASFTVPAGDAHALLVTLRISQDGYTLLSYQYVPTGDWNAESGLNLYN